MKKLLFLFPAYCFYLVILSRGNGGGSNDKAVEEGIIPDIQAGKMTAKISEGETIEESPKELEKGSLLFLNRSE